jgi:mevalonate kinase
MKGRGNAPGKVIVTGEHAVVYGHRAVAMAIDRGTEVELTPIDGPTTIVEAPIDDARLQRCVALLLPANGLSVRIRSTLPIGRGLGSSASLSVALVRAIASYEGRTAPYDECFEKAFVAERHFHGTPSGIDHATVASGGALVFDPKGPEFSELPLTDARLVAIDSGTAGDTKVLVAQVRARIAELRPVIDEIGAVSEAVIARLSAGGTLFDAAPELRENQRLLATLGVSTGRIDTLVAWALEHGAAAAKLSGAGGGGIVIALHEDPEVLVAEAIRAGHSAFVAARAA